MAILLGKKINVNFRKVFLATFLSMASIISFSVSAQSCQEIKVEEGECEFTFKEANNGQLIKSEYKTDNRTGLAAALCNKGSFEIKNARCDFTPSNAMPEDCAGVPANNWFMDGESCSHDNKDIVVKNGEDVTLESINGDGEVTYKCIEGYLNTSSLICGYKARRDESSTVKPFAVDDIGDQFVCTSEQSSPFSGTAGAVDSGDCDALCGPSPTGFNFVKEVTAKNYTCGCDCTYEIDSGGSDNLDNCRGTMLGDPNEALFAGVPYFCVNDVCYKDECNAQSGSASLCKTCTINNIQISGVSDNEDGICRVSLDEVYSGTNKNQDFLENDYHGQVSYYCMNGALTLNSKTCFKTCRGDTVSWGQQDSDGRYSFKLGIDKWNACRADIPESKYRNEERTNVLTSETNTGQAIFKCDGYTGEWVNDKSECELSCNPIARWFDVTESNEYDRRGRRKGYDSSKANHFSDPDGMACSATIPSAKRKDGSLVNNVNSSHPYNAGQADLKCIDGYWEVQPGATCNMHCDHAVPAVTKTDGGYSCDFPAADFDKHAHGASSPTLKNQNLINNGEITYICNDGQWDVRDYSCTPKLCNGQVTWTDGGNECKANVSNLERNTDVQVTDNYNPPAFPGTDTNGQAYAECLPAQDKNDTEGVLQWDTSKSSYCELSRDGSCNETTRGGCFVGISTYDANDPANLRYEWVKTTSTRDVENGDLSLGREESWTIPQSCGWEADCSYSGARTGWEVMHEPIYNESTGKCEDGELRTSPPRAIETQYIPAFAPDPETVQNTCVTCESGDTTTCNMIISGDDSSTKGCSVEILSDFTDGEEIWSSGEVAPASVSERCHDQSISELESGVTLRCTSSGLVCN